MGRDSTFSRRELAGVLGGAAAAVAACTVAATRPGEVPAGPDGRPAPVGLRAGAGPARAPAADPAAIPPARSTAWRPQRAPATGPALLRQPPTILGLDQRLHLARRAAYGPTPQLLDEIGRLGPAGWVASQLAPQRIPDSTVDGLLAHYPLLAATPQQLKQTAGRDPGSYFVAHDQLAEAKIIRAAYSRRQLFETVAEFWSDFLHLPIYLDRTRHTAVDFDATVIRGHALGRFTDMLWACWTHPAMLRYLDAAESDKANVNQNSGREILEQHSLGVHGGYQPRTDVVQAALVMTGLGIDEQTLTFRYSPDRHHTGRVRVLGWSAANDDPRSGLAVFRSLVRYLALHPATARHIATDLARRFVSDAPPVSLVDRLALVYQRAGSAIGPVLRELFGSAEFRLSVGQKYRRPLESTAASLRTLGFTFDPAGPGALTDAGTLRGVRDLRYQLDRMGHLPHGHPAPDGYPDHAAAWLSPVGTLGRWNLATSLVQGWWTSGSQPPWTRLYGRPPRSYGEAVDLLTERLLHQRVSAGQRAALLEFLGQPAGTPVADPDLGGRLTPLVALILDAPHHQLR